VSVWARDSTYREEHVIAASLYSAFAADEEMRGSRPGRIMWVRL
jgi:hypothetical protein